MGHLILPPDLIDNLGPAVTSGRSILMYGPPGNGKSSISHGIRAAIGDKIYVPRAIEYSGPGHLGLRPDRPFRRRNGGRRPEPAAPHLEPFRPTLCLLRTAPR
jgi:hypothetical protein